MEHAAEFISMNELKKRVEDHLIELRSDIWFNYKWPNTPILVYSYIHMLFLVGDQR